MCADTGTRTPIGASRNFDLFPIDLFHFLSGLGLQVTALERSQSVLPFNPGKIEHKLLIQPRKVKECFRKPPDRERSATRKASAKKFSQMLLPSSVEEADFSKDVKPSKRIRLLRSIKNFRWVGSIKPPKR